MTSPSAARTDWKGALGAGAIAFAVYGLSMCREVFWGDSAELSLRAASVELSPVARGYPLHRTLSYLFGRVLGDPALGTNLLSVAAGAATVALLYEFGRRLGGDRRLAGVVAAAAGGLAHTVWFFAGIAEVYALHGLFLIAAIFLAIGAVAGSRRRRFALGLVLGLSLLHHRMIAFALPALAAYLVLGLRAMPRGDRVRRIAGIAIGFAAGVVPFALLCAFASRSPPAGTEGGFAWWFRDVFLGGDANAEHVFGSGTRSFAANSMYLLRWIAFNLPGPALLLAAIGLVRLARTARDRFVLFVLLIPVHLVFPFRYDWTGDQFAFLAPLYPVLAVLAAVGLDAVAAKRSAQTVRIWAAAVIAAPVVLILALAFTPLGGAVFPGRPAAERARLIAPWHSGERPASEHARPILAEVPQDAVLHCDWGDGQVYRYLQAVEGLRPDVRVRIWYGTMRPVGEDVRRGSEEWVAVLPGRTEIPRALASVADRLEPRGERLFRLREAPR